MGIEFSRGKAHWSYTRFHIFRIRLAAEIGIDLDDMRGFKWSKKHGYGRGKSWDKVKDPIALLLNHSDSSGDLSPKQCAKVAPRLRELVSSWPDDFNKLMALQLAEAFDECAFYGERLLFW